MSSSKPRMRPFSSPSRFITTSGGVSCIRLPVLKLFPGTLGTLPAIPLWWLFAEIIGFHFIIMVLVTIIIAWPGGYLVNSVCRDLGVHDDGRVTLDEVAGYFTTMLIADVFFDPVGFGWMWAGFGLFRAFDMIKPFPVWLFDKEMSVAKGPWIMLDDIVAGVIAGGFTIWFSVETYAAWLGLAMYAVFIIWIRMDLWLGMRRVWDKPPSFYQALINPPPDW